MRCAPVCGEVWRPESRRRHARKIAAECHVQSVLTTDHHTNAKTVVLVFAHMVALSTDAKIAPELVSVNIAAHVTCASFAVALAFASMVGSVLVVLFAKARKFVHMGASSTDAKIATGRGSASMGRTNAHVYYVMEVVCACTKGRSTFAKTVLGLVFANTANCVTFANNVEAMDFVNTEYENQSAESAVVLQSVFMIADGRRATSAIQTS